MAFPDIKTTVLSLAAIAGALLGILSLFEKGQRIFLGIWHWFTSLFTNKSTYKVDLKIVPDHGFCQWQEGSGEFGKEAMLVYCKLYLTNIAPIRPFQILDTYIKKPFTRGYIHPRPRQAEIPMIPALGDARLASEFSAQYTISPPVCKSKATYICDVILVDQFGKEHKAKSVQFQPVGGPAWDAIRKQREHEKKTWEQIKEGQKQVQEIKDEAKKLESPETKKTSQ